MSAFAIEAVARQYGATIDMLENAIVACPDAHWGGPNDWQAFWYLASHTLFWLDYYLEDDPARFRPPAPFGLEEMDPEGVLPRVHTKAELLAYLAHGRAKCRAVFAALTEEAAALPSGFARREGTRFELHIYSLRHVQHHTGQLQLLLRRAGVTPPRWVSRSAGTWDRG